MVESSVRRLFQRYPPRRGTRTAKRRGVLFIWFFPHFTGLAALLPLSKITTFSSTVEQNRTRQKQTVDVTSFFYSLRRERRRHFTYRTNILPKSRNVRNYTSPDTTQRRRVENARIVLYYAAVGHGGRGIAFTPRILPAGGACVRVRVYNVWISTSVIHYFIDVRAVFESISAAHVTRRRTTILFEFFYATLHVKRQLEQYRPKCGKYDVRV